MKTPNDQTLHELFWHYEDGSCSHPDSPCPQPDDDFEISEPDFEAILEARYEGRRDRFEREWGPS